MTGHQVWGTFAVSDHVVRRAFVADVLLYDRLVVSVPTDEDFERWEMKKWQPARLRTLLNVLDDPDPDYCLAREVQWGPRHRLEWEDRWKNERRAAQRSLLRFGSAGAVAFDDEILRGNRDQGTVDPFYITPMMLYDEGGQERDRGFFERHPDVTVESVAAYPSYATFEEEAETPGNHALIAGPGNSVGLIGWEFFVPDDDSLEATRTCLLRPQTLTAGQRFDRSAPTFTSYGAEPSRRVVGIVSFARA